MTNIAALAQALREQDEIDAGGSEDAARSSWDRAGPLIHGWYRERARDLIGRYRRKTGQSLTVDVAAEQPEGSDRG